MAGEGKGREGGLCVGGRGRIAKRRAATAIESLGM